MAAKRVRPDQISFQIKSFAAVKSRKGQKCGECGKTFEASTGDGKRLVSFPNVSGGISQYVLCKPCGAHYDREGTAAIPNAVTDSILHCVSRARGANGKAPIH